jgi:hypothetical protein
MLTQTAFRRFSSFRQANFGCQRLPARGSSFARMCAVPLRGDIHELLKVKLIVNLHIWIDKVVKALAGPALGTV